MTTIWDGYTNVRSVCITWQPNPGELYFIVLVHHGFNRFAETAGEHELNIFIRENESSLHFSDTVRLPLDDITP
jgi:hypothetical protein